MTTGILEPRQTTTQPPASQPLVPYAQSPYAVDPAGLIDLHDVLRMLRRRRGVIIGSILLLSSVAVLFAFQLTPRYTASALLTLQTRKEDVVDIQAVMSGLTADSSVLRTELDVISSHRLIEKLVDKLHLTKDPEFNGSLREKSPLATALDPRSYLSPEWLTTLGIRAEDEQILSEAEKQDLEMGKVVEAVTGALTVTNPKLSYTIQISFESEDPKKAALLVNTLADLYLTDQLEAKFEATQRATEWLNERVTDLRTRVLTAENAVQTFREKNRIIQAGNQGTVDEQQLSQLNLQLVTAQTDLAGAEARYNQVKSQVERGSNTASVGEVLSSQLIQRLGEQEAEVRRKQAEVAKRYGPRHPETINIGSELADIRAKIAEETNKILDSLHSAVQVARARVNTLSSSLDGLKTQNTDVEKARVQLRELEREASTSRALLETFLARFKETSAQSDFQQADARIISKARAPVEPSFPNKKLILAVALVLSTMVGLGLALLLESLDKGFRELEQLQRLLGIKGMGSVPRLSGRNLKGLPPFRYALERPTSGYSESLRSVYMTLMTAQRGGTLPKTILVTSSLPGEGKTTFSLSLASLQARVGNRRVLYIEGDLRRANVAKSMFESDKTEATLTQYLAGDIAHWRDCVSTDQTSGLNVILAGGKAEDPQMLLQSERLRTLFQESAQEYDLIIIDSPPLLALSDAVILSGFADTMLFVVQWEATSRDIARKALDILRNADVPVTGVVLTQVDVKKSAHYGSYGYYGYNYYASYYGRDRD